LKYDFFSVVIPFFLHTHYLKSLVESIHRHADIPFEIIVHDDRGIDHSSLAIEDKVSTIVLNLGKNLGLAASANRAIACANGKYILFLNQDCEIIRPCLRDYAKVLDKPYVGVLSPYGDPYPQTSPEWIETEGVKFTLRHGISGCCALAFRKEVWEEIGGFEEIISGCCDTTLMYKMYRAGYFRAVALGERWIRNISLEEKGNSDTTIGPYGDCGYPRVFNLNNYDELCRKRAWECQRRQDEHQKEPAGISNIDYWHGYSVELMPQSGVISSIDWEVAKRHGQIKWKPHLERETIYCG